MLKQRRLPAASSAFCWDLASSLTPPAGEHVSSNMELPERTCLRTEYVYTAKVPPPCPGADGHISEWCNGNGPRLQPSCTVRRTGSSTRGGKRSGGSGASCVPAAPAPARWIEKSSFTWMLMKQTQRRRPVLSEGKRTRAGRVLRRLPVLTWKWMCGVGPSNTPGVEQVCWRWGLAHSR